MLLFESTNRSASQPTPARGTGVALAALAALLLLATLLANRLHNICLHRLRPQHGCNVHTQRVEPQKVRLCRSRMTYARS